MNANENDNHSGRVLWVSLASAAVLIAVLAVVYYGFLVPARRRTQEAASETEAARVRRQEREIKESFLTARDLLLRGETGEALRLVNDSIERFPGSVLLLALRAEIQRCRESIKEAHSDFATADELNEAHPFLHIVEGNLALDTGSPGMAEKAYRAAIELDNSFAMAHVALGRLERRRGRPEKAIEELNRAIALDGDDPDAYFERALTRFARSDYAAAERDFRIVTEKLKSPYHLRADFFNGLSLMALGKPREALAKFEAASLYESTFAHVYAFRAASELKTGDYTHALRDVSQAIAIDDGIGFAYAVRAEVRFLEKDFKGSLGDAEQALELGAADVLDLWDDSLDESEPRAAPVWVEEWLSLARYRLGRARFELGEFEDALASFMEIKASPPGEHVPAYYIGRIHALRKEYNAALESLDAAIRAQPRNALAFLERAKVLAATGDNRTALTELRKTLGMDGSLLEAHELYARLLMEQGRRSEAIAAYGNVVRLAPDDAASRLELGRLLLDEGRLDEAEKELSLAIALDAKTAAARFHRARLFFMRFEKTGKDTLPRALTDADEAIALGLVNADTFLLRAEINYAMEEWPGALADYREAAARGAKGKEISLRIGMLYAKVGELSEAKSVLKKHLNETRALVTLGEIAVAENNSNEAVEYFTKAIAAEPDNARIYCMRGLAYKNMKKPAAALADFSTAIEKDANHREALFARGDYYLTMRKGPEAAADFARLVKLEPQSARALAGRGRAHFYMGEYEKAIKDFDAALKIDPAMVNLREYIEAARKKM
jgi:tetratricopeptide (TPR) repeat protein